MIIDQEHYKTVIQPQIRDLKLLIASDMDNLPILHREDILNKRGDFIKLRDASIATVFDNNLMAMLENCDYTVCSVVLDKKAHLDKYGAAAFHPYHYCLNVILEKYTYYLHSRSARGDVVAEARGGKDDRRLEKEYSKFFNNGTQFRSAEYIQQVLSSKDLKIRRKDLRIEGLEIADLLTLASKIDVLHTYGQIESLDSNFQTKIIRKIQTKYLRNGAIMKGYGKKYLG